MNSILKFIVPIIVYLYDNKLFTSWSYCQLTCSEFSLNVSNLIVDKLVFILIENFCNVEIKFIIYLREEQSPFFQKYPWEISTDTNRLDDIIEGIMCF